MVFYNYIISPAMLNMEVAALWYVLHSFRIHTKIDFATPHIISWLWNGLDLVLRHISDLAWGEKKTKTQKGFAAIISWYHLPKVTTYIMLELSDGLILNFYISFSGKQHLVYPQPYERGGTFNGCSHTKVHVIDVNDANNDGDARRKCNNNDSDLEVIYL